MKTILKITAILPLLISTSIIQSANANSIDRNSIVQNLDVSKFTSLFKPPQKDRQPEITFGGATRGNSCSANSDNQKELTALVANNIQTTKELPEFLAYIPENKSNKATITIKDASEDYFYRETINLQGANQINSIKVSDKAPSLQKGKTYQVFLKLICDREESITDPEIKIEINRIELAANNTQDKLEKQVQFFGERGIWFDTLNAAYRLKENYGNNAYWNAMMQSTDNVEFIDNN